MASANISNVINVALIPEGQLASRDNMNLICVVTSEQGVLSSAERFRTYKDAQAVAADFGSASPVTEYANTVFSTRPNAINFGGSLIIGYHRGAEEVVPATAGRLTSTQLSEPAVVPVLQAIQDGSFAVDVDGITQTVTALDLRIVTELSDLVTILNAEITGATVALVNGRFIITSATTGASSEVGFFESAGSGTFIGDILTLSGGSGATSVDGVASETLTIETKVDALTAIKSGINFKGACFIDQVLDGEVEGIATWAGANSTLIYNVFSGSDYLQVNPTNPVWATRLSSLVNFRMLFSASGNRKLAATYMARVHTVNFNAENSAITMNLKTLAVPAESYSQTVIDAAYRVGLDIYTTIKDVPVVLTSPANDFVDNVYNLVAFVDAVQTDMFNLLKQTGTKIPQTTRGVNQLVAQGEKTTRGFVRAGVFAPGTWSSPDTFGDVELFNRSIEQNGFYWLAGELSEQPQSDRQERKSPVLQCAVKNAGAIHKVDVIIQFNA